MKRVFLLLLLLLLLTALLCAAAEPGFPYIQVSDASVEPGTRVTTVVLQFVNMKPPQGRTGFKVSAASWTVGVIEGDPTDFKCETEVPGKAITCSQLGSSIMVKIGGSETPLEPGEIGKLHFVVGPKPIKLDFRDFVWTKVQ